MSVSCPMTRTTWQWVPSFSPEGELQSRIGAISHAFISVLMTTALRWCGP